MGQEQTKPPFNREPVVPEGLDWSSLMKRDGDVVFDGPHAELRVGHIDDDVLRVVGRVAPMD